MKVLYSYNKNGYEEVAFKSYINKISNGPIEVFPFNHSKYLSLKYYFDANSLEHSIKFNTLKLDIFYAQVESLIKSENITHLLVDNSNPYHYSFLERLKVKKIYRATDGPMVATLRDAIYANWFDFVFINSTHWSCGENATNAFKRFGSKEILFVPFGSIDYYWQPLDCLSHKRIDKAIFVGSLHKNKIDILSKIYHTGKIKIYGKSTIKQNLYFILKSQSLLPIKKLSFNKINKKYLEFDRGLNIHNWGLDSFGNYRLYDYLVHGVFQICEDASDFILGLKMPEYMFKFFKTENDLKELLKINSGLSFNDRYDAALYSREKFNASILMRNGLKKIL